MSDRSRALHEILAAWRQAEQRLAGTAPDDPSRSAAEQEERDLHDLYRFESSRRAARDASRPGSTASRSGGTSSWRLTGLVKRLAAGARGESRPATIVIWTPVFVLTAALVLATAIRPRGAFDPPWLLTPANLIFLTLIPLAAAVLAVPTYRRTGVLAVLSLGTGLLVIGLGAGVVAAVMLYTVGTNDLLTVHNTSVFVGGGCQFTAALAGVLGVSIASRRSSVLAIAYTLGAAVVLATVALALADLLPQFWTSESGFTTTRSVVLGLAAALFAVGAFTWWQTALRDRQIVFLAWYVPGLALFALGLTGVLLQNEVGGLQSWVGRLGQYLGALYMLVAVTVESTSVAGNRPTNALGVALLQAGLPFRSLVESTSDAVVALGRERRVIYWNDTAQRMFGYSSAEAFDCSPLNLWLPATGLAASRASLRELTESPAQFLSRGRQNLILADRDGHRFPAELAAFASPNDRRLVVCVIEDISARVRAREELERHVRERTAELQQANEELARANAAKDEFLGLVSHELKTPITTILAASALLERRFGRADTDGVLNDLVADAHRLAGVVDNLLALARLDAGRTPRAEPVALDRLLSRVAGRVCREYPERDVEVAAEPGVIVEANEEQLELVVRNYVANALKYSPDGGRVEILLRKDGQRAVVSVKDRGPGIKDEEAALLFEPFYRSRSTASTPGMGIGLTVCRRVVESLGGTVRAATRSDPPGAVFEFSVPLAALDFEASHSASEPDPAAATQVELV